MELDELRRRVGFSQWLTGIVFFWAPGVTGTFCRGSQTICQNSGDQPQVAERRANDAHLRMTGDARAEECGVFDNASALLQHVAEELGDADEAGII